jgi:hypothetical protein
MNARQYVRITKLEARAMIMRMIGEGFKDHLHNDNLVGFYKFDFVTNKDVWSDTELCFIDDIEVRLYWRP